MAKFQNAEGELEGRPICKDVNGLSGKMSLHTIIGNEEAWEDRDEI
jgi:hypothetical protein